MERMLYLWRSSEERVAVDQHLVVLADKGGAHVVLVAQLRRRKLQSTCTSSSLRIRMERTFYLWRSSEERVAVDLYLVVLADRDGFQTWASTGLQLSPRVGGLLTTR